MYSKKLIIITASIAVALVAVIVIAFIVQQTNESNLAKSEAPLIGETTVDPVSGETVTESSREHTSGERAMTLLGFSELIDHGLGMDQYGQLERKFAEFNTRYDTDIVQISMYEGSSKTARQGEGKDRVSQRKFDIQVNQKDDYAATIEYTSLDSMTLKIYTMDRSKLLYTL